MKIAVFKQGNKVSQHFGHSEGFMVYELDQNQIKSSQEVSNNGAKGCQMASFLKENGINKVIVGGIGENAKSHLDENNIELILGAYGHIDDVIHDYCNNELKLNDVTPHQHNAHHHSDH